MSFPKFLSLPLELRTQIYSLVLLHPDPIGPWSFNYDTLNPSLFRVNKTIHYETTPIFYSQNRLSLKYAYSKKIARFLAQIGRVNANYIRHIYIEFPNFVYLRSGDVLFEAENHEILTIIRSRCANLSALTMTPQYIEIYDCALDMLNTLDEYHFKVISEALKLVNTQVRSIPCLRRIIIEVDKYYGLNGVILGEMESQGWMINVKLWKESRRRR